MPRKHAKPKPAPQARPTPAATPAPAIDIEAQAIAARARRVARCEQELWPVMSAILEKHGCRIGTTQEIIDGNPGRVDVRVFSK